MVQSEGAPGPYDGMSEDKIRDAILREIDKRTSGEDKTWMIMVQEVNTKLVRVQAATANDAYEKMQTGDGIEVMLDNTENLSPVITDMDNLNGPIDPESQEWASRVQGIGGKGSSRTRPGRSNLSDLLKSRRPQSITDYSDDEVESTMDSIADVVAKSIARADEAQAEHMRNQDFYDSSPGYEFD